MAQRIYVKHKTTQCLNIKFIEQRETTFVNIRIRNTAKRRRASEQLTHISLHIPSPEHMYDYLNSIKFEWNLH